MNAAVEAAIGNFLQKLHVLQDEDELIQTILQDLPGLVSGSNSMVAVHQPSSRQILQISLQHPLSSAGFLESVNTSGVVEQHPFWKPLQRARPKPKILSAMMSQRTWSRHPLYADLLREECLRDHMTIDIRTHGNCLPMIGVWRDRRGFSDVDASVFQFIAPHIEIAFDNAQRIRQARRSGEGVARHVFLDSGMLQRPLECFRACRAAWEARLGCDLRVAADEFCGWLKCQLTAIERGCSESVLQGYSLSGTYGSIELRLHRCWTGEGCILSEQSSIHAALLHRLTQREAQVLHWLQEGKTDGEIAIILGISRHTVKDYVKAVFRKLGIHNRTQAALFTIRC